MILIFDDIYVNTTAYYTGAAEYAPLSVMNTQSQPMYMSEEYDQPDSHLTVKAKKSTAVYAQGTSYEKIDAMKKSDEKLYGESMQQHTHTILYINMYIIFIYIYILYLYIVTHK